MEAITANQLRVGNMIKVNGLVVTIDKRTIFDFDHDGKSKEGIEISEEWLIRFGFVKDEEDGLGLRINYTDGLCFYDDVMRLIVQGEECPLYKIKFVHQLQNLYFALTNEELKIKVI